MLGKLLKHEFIGTARYFLPVYVFAAILTPVFSLLFRLGFHNDALIPSIMSVFGISGFVIAMVALFAASTILNIMRFYRTTATSEAYLTFTLPANPGQVLVSKLLIASLWQLLSFVIGMTAVIGMLFISGIVSPGDMADVLSTMIKYIFDNNDSVTVAMFISYAFCAIIGIPSGILMYYCSIMLGQLFAEHRVIASFGMFMAISTVTQILSLFVTVPVTMATSHHAVDTAYAMNMTVGLATILNIVIGAACYITTFYIMKKKLNVR